MRLIDHIQIEFQTAVAKALDLYEHERDSITYYEVLLENGYCFALVSKLGQNKYNSITTFITISDRTITVRNKDISAVTITPNPSLSQILTAICAESTEPVALQRLTDNMVSLDYNLSTIEKKSNAEKQ